jgi:hypothetical protein
MLHDTSSLLLFSSAGGGGSDSDGGGDIIGLIAYIPSHWLASIVKKHFARPVAMAITCVSASVFTLVFLSFAFLGTIPFFVGILLIAGLWGGWYAAMFDIWDKLKKRTQKADADIATAAQTDSIWNEASLHEAAQTIFMRYQTDWSKLQTNSLSEYMTPSYAQHAYLMMRALFEMKRLNIVENPRIARMDTIAIHDDSDNTKDTFTVMIQADINDRLFDTMLQQNLVVVNKTIAEEWHFTRSPNNTWLLSGITPTTANTNFAVSDIANFASQNGLYYSLDWGTLLVPNRGQLFKNKDALTSADINNHLIGLWNNRLIQIYTYRQPDGNGDSKNYFIAQLNVPKNYGGIIIRRKKGFLAGITLKKMKNADGLTYEKYEFEWPDFNKRYEVFATDQSRLAAFELLNPGFMTYLYDTGLDVNIEVVDTTVYLYRDQLPDPTTYPAMLEILSKAFKELQL